MIEVEKMGSLGSCGGMFGQADWITEVPLDLMRNASDSFRMDFDPGYLAAAMLAGLIGMGYLMYGKKAGDVQGIVIGAVISFESVMCQSAVGMMVALGLTIGAHVVWRKISPT